MSEQTFPPVIFADDDLLCSTIPSEGFHTKYIRHDAVNGMLNEAAEIIATMVASGMEDTNTLRRARAWLTANRYEHLL